MKLIDFEKLFDEKLAQYMKESKKKRSAKAWEDVIPKLYQQFGDTYIAKIKSTPKQYYSNMTDEELLQTLTLHLENEVAVPEFLSDEIEKRDLFEGLLALLEREDPAISEYVVAILGEDSRAFDAYLSILRNEDAGEDLKSNIVAIFCEHADLVKTGVLEGLDKGLELEFALEILSHVIERDERIYNFLLQSFLNAEDWQLALHARYMATYGDERALPHLIRRIQDRSIGFVEFQELKYAIEALGGEYEEERDFSADKDYLIVEASKEEGAKENQK